MKLKSVLACVVMMMTLMCCNQPADPLCVETHTGWVKGVEQEGTMEIGRAHV